jgi:tetratricopeptide (TPR) repeat protein
MFISQLVTKEFEKIFPSILKNGRVELSVEDLMDAPNAYIMEELNHLKGVRGVNENERKNLESFISLMDEAEALFDYDEEINKMLTDYIHKYPGITSFKFFQIMYQVNHYLDGGLNIDTICVYYNDIFENQSDLVNLEDFFQICDFLIPVLLLEHPSKELISTFQFAIDKFPEKALLRFTLGRLFEMRNDIEQALDWNLQFLGQIEADRIYNETKNTYELKGDSITSEFYNITLLNICTLFFKNNEFENALDYSNKCLNEFQLISEDIYSFQTLFVDPLTVRLRIHIQEGNIDEFKKDWKKRTMRPPLANLD